MNERYDFGHDHQVMQLRAKLDEHVKSSSNPHSITKAQIGLGQVEDIAPENMPVSADTRDYIDCNAARTIKISDIDIGKGKYRFSLISADGDVLSTADLDTDTESAVTGIELRGTILTVYFGQGVDPIHVSLEPIFKYAESVAKEEADRSQAAEGAITQSLDDEAARATAAEEAVSASIAQEAARASAAEAANAEAILAEAARAQAAETNLGGDIGALDAAVLHNAGAETAYGLKTFADGIKVGSTTLTEATLQKLIELAEAMTVEETD